MIKCITCDNRAFPLCKNCAKNPYFVEKARRVLSQKNKDTLFRSLYGKNYAEIKDRNTRDFWDEMFENPASLGEEDPSAKEKIVIVSSFIPYKVVKLLDLGIGEGLIEEYLQRKEKRYNFYGIDISKKSIELVNKRVKGNFEVGSIYNLKYKNESFDVVLALDLLEHIPPSRIFKLLAKIRKLLKSEGFLIGSVPLNERIWSLEVNESSHLREYSLDLIEKELKLSGFRLVKDQTIIAFPSLYFLKKFVAKYILTRRWNPNELIFKAQKI